MFGKLNEIEIEELLSRQFIARIGCHANGKTYVVPINYAYDGEYVYCHTHEGMKTTIMRENPKVCFETDAMESMATWKSVIAWGEFEELTDNNERTKAFDILLARTFPFMISKALKTELGNHYPFLPDDLNSIKGIVFRIKLEEKTGRFDVQDNLKAVIAG